jgi:hypothetical protein
VTFFTSRARQDDARDLLASWFEDVQAEQTASPIDQPLRSIFGNGRPEGYGISLQVRGGEIWQEGDYGDHARQAGRRPQSWAFGATGLGHCEIAPPSAARNHPVRRH